jgi:Helicase HerA, central domain
MSATDMLRDQARPAPAPAEPLGQVSAISGSQVSVSLLANNPGSLHAAAMTVGKFVKMMSGNALLVGVVTDVSGQAASPARDQRFHATALVDLMGEIERSAAPRFRRGVANYPTIGDSVAPLSADEMRIIFDNPRAKSVKIGHLQQDSKIAVGVDIDEMLSKHFAVLGTTGVGKSSAVALVLH